MSESDRLTEAANEFILAHTRQDFDCSDMYRTDMLRDLVDFLRREREDAVRNATIQERADADQVEWMEAIRPLEAALSREREVRRGLVDKLKWLRVALKTQTAHTGISELEMEEVVEAAIAAAEKEA